MSHAAFRLIVIIAVALALVLAGAAGFMVLEDLSFGNAVYFTVVTLATVGYGDIYPTTAGGKILAVIFIIAGVAVFLTVTAEIVNLLLQRRREQIRKERLNVLVGVFFSEIGNSLLRSFSGFDPGLDGIRKILLIDQSSTDQDFNRLNELLGRYDYTIEPALMKLEPLRDFLDARGDLLVRLLENQNLMEHESFTELLRGIFHLKEELILRPRLINLPDADLAHLSNDIKRAYSLLGKQWVSYMQYLKLSYPYLFSLAFRSNPFSRELSPIIT